MSSRSKRVHRVMKESEVRKTGKQTSGERHRERERETEKERERQTEREKERKRETVRDRERIPARHGVCFKISKSSVTKLKVNYKERQKEDKQTEREREKKCEWVAI